MTLHFSNCPHSVTHTLRPYFLLTCSYSTACDSQRKEPGCCRAVTVQCCGTSWGWCTSVDRQSSTAEGPSPVSRIAPRCSLTSFCLSEVCLHCFIPLSRLNFLRHSHWTWLPIWFSLRCYHCCDGCVACQPGLVKMCLLHDTTYL